MSKRKAKTTVIKDDEALCVLIKGKEIVQDRWIKGEYEQGDKVCALGAIGLAAAGKGTLLQTHTSYTLGPTHPAIVAANELAKVVRSHNGPGGFDSNDADYFEKIPGWNDSGSRRRSQVVAAFDRAIKRRVRKLAQEK